MAAPPPGNVADSCELSVTTKPTPPEQIMDQKEFMKEALNPESIQVTHTPIHLGFRISGSVFRIQGLWFKVSGSGFLVQGFGFRVLVSGFWV